MMDASLFGAINGLAGHVDGIDDLFELASRFLPFALIGLLLGLWFWPGEETQRTTREWACMAATISAALALALNQIIILLWDRPRPFAEHPAIMLLQPSQDPSFPSDHATFAFAVAVTIYLVNRRAGLAALALAALLAFTRVYVGEHYVGDVLGGALIGSLTALVIYQARPVVMPLLAVPLRLARRVHLA